MSFPIRKFLSKGYSLYYIVRDKFNNIKQFIDNKYPGLWPKILFIITSLITIIGIVIFLNSQFIDLFKIDNPMMFSILEIMIGGLIGYIIWRDKLVHIKHLIEIIFSEKWVYISNIVIKTLLFYLALHLIIDPLFPGQATIILKTQPQVYQEDIRARIAPIRCNGKTDWARLSDKKFDIQGIIVTIINFNFFENRIQIYVYDYSGPERAVASRIERVSLYARLGIHDKHINLDLPKFTR